MAAVVDTNVLISYFLLRDSVPGQAVRKAVHAGPLIFTEPTFGELLAVLNLKKFDRYTTRALRRQFLADITAMADIVPVTRQIRACRDREDDKFLEAAIYGNADYLITGDEDLLVLHPFMTVAILSPADFLNV